MKRFNFAHHAQMSIFWNKSISSSTYILNLTGSLDPWIPIVLHKKVEFHTSCTNITLLIQIYKNWYLRLKLDWILGSLDPSKYSMKRLNFMHHAQISLFWYKSIRISTYALNLTGSLDPWIFSKYSMKRLNFMHHAKLSLFWYKCIRISTYS